MPRSFGPLNIDLDLASLPDDRYDFLNPQLPFSKPGSPTKSVDTLLAELKDQKRLEHNARARERYHAKKQARYSKPTTTPKKQ